MTLIVALLWTMNVLARFEDSSYETSIGFYNTGTTSITVQGTLYNEDGSTVGTPDSELINLSVSETAVLTVQEIEQAVNGTSTSTQGWLEISPQNHLLVQPLMRVRTSGAWINMSALVEGTTNGTTGVSSFNVFGLPDLNSPSEGFVRFCNTGTTTTPIRGTLYDQAGNVIGMPQSVLIPDLSPKNMAVMTLHQLAQAIGGKPKNGPFGLQLESDSTQVTVQSFIRNKSSPPSELNNLSAEAAKRLSGGRSLWNTPLANNAGSIQLYNTGTTASTVQGTLYNQDGNVIGDPNTVLVDSTLLSPQSTIILTTADIINTVNGTLSPSDRLWLSLQADSENISIQSLNTTHHHLSAELERQTVGAVSSFKALNVRPSGSTLHFYNTGSTTTTLRGTLYDSDGEMIFWRLPLIYNLAPKNEVNLTSDDIAQLENGPYSWTGEGWLLIEMTSPNVSVQAFLSDKNISHSASTFIPINFINQFINTAPTVSNLNKNGLEDQTFSFEATDFTNAFFDNDGDSLTEIRITALSTEGTLKLNDVPINLNDEINVTELGQLTFTPNADWFGTTTLSWNGSDFSQYAQAPALINITIEPVNDAPIFNVGDNQNHPAGTVGPQTMNTWATAINPGNSFENGQTLTFNATVLSDPNAILAGAPVIDSLEGHLSYQLTGQTGTAQIQVTLQDNGSVTNEGQDTSLAASFTINIEASGEVEPNSHNFNGILVGRNSAGQTFSFLNRGDKNLQVGQLNLTTTTTDSLSNITSIATTDFRFVSDGCSNTVVETIPSPSSLCQITVVFQPQSVGQKQATLLIPYLDGQLERTLTIPLVGEGEQNYVSNIEVNPSSYNFGEVQVGNYSKYQVFRISNTGNATLELGQLYFSGESHFVIPAHFDLCSHKKVAPSQYCSVVMSFRPQTAGAHQANLLIPSNAPNNPTARISLTGTGLTACGEFEFFSYPPVPDFGTVTVGETTALSQHVYFVSENCTNAPKISDIQILGSDKHEFSYDSMECYNGQFEQAFYASCWFNTRFSPTVAGVKNAELHVIFDSRLKTVSLKAQAEEATHPEIEVSPQTLDFGPVTLDIIRSKQLTIKNIGDANLDLDRLHLTGTDTAAFRVRGCIHRTLKPSEQCKLRVTFRAKTVGNKQASLEIHSNAENVNPVIIPITGNGTEPVNCSDENITIETIASGLWAEKSGRRQYNNPSLVWKRRQNFKSGESETPNHPRATDVVRIKAGHQITAIPYAKVKAICIEKNGTLSSLDNQGTYLKLYATDHIENKGLIQGQHGANESADATTCTSRYSVNNKNCAQSGASVYLLVGSAYGDFRNEGTVLSGHGGDGKHYGAHGGHITVRAGGITNTDEIGSIHAGRGGNLTETLQGIAGRGGLVSISAKDYLVSDGLQIRAGNGGQCHANATEPQTGGNGGNLRLNARNQVDLLNGTFAAGQGAKNCEPLGTNGKDGLFNADPGELTLSGLNTKIEGGDITLFGGHGWILNLTGLTETAITATGDITLAVGDGGAIDFRGSTGKILKAANQVNIFADQLVLDDHVRLSDLIDAPNTVTGPSKILHDVFLIGPNKLSGETNSILPIDLTLSNEGPETDSYFLNVTDTAGWLLSGLPSTIEVNGLDSRDLVLNATLPTTGGVNNTITITAISAADPSVTASVDVQVAVEPSAYAFSLSAPQALSGDPTSLQTFDLVVNNQGLAADRYLITVEDVASWVLTPSSQTTEAIQGSSSLSLPLTVTLPATGGEENVITMTVTSSADPTITARIQMPAMVEKYAVLLTGPKQLSGKPNQQVSLPLTLYNQGAKKDTYSFQVQDNAGWVSSALPATLEVEGSNNQSLILNATLPATDGMVNTITITATSLTDTNATSQVAVPVKVTETPPLYEVSLTGPTQLSGQPNSVQSFDIVIYNQGTGTDSYEMTVTDTANWVLNPSSGTTEPVAGAGQTTFKLNVNLPTTSGLDNLITVTAKSSNSNVTDSIQVKATVEKLPVVLNNTTSGNTSSSNSSTVQNTTNSSTSTNNQVVTTSPNEEDIPVIVDENPPVETTTEDTTVETVVDEVKDPSETILFPNRSLCPDSGSIKIVCKNPDDHVMTDVTIESEASVTGGRFAGNNENHGLVSNVTIEPEAQIFGGTFTGFIDNEGTLADFKFIGGSITGGLLANEIENSGTLKNISLAKGTHIMGGVLSEQVQGDCDEPALLENLIVEANTALSCVIIGDNVTLKEGITFQDVQITAPIQIVGSELQGDFVNEGVSLSENVLLQNIHLAADSYLKGVKVQGHLQGHLQAPARLEDVEIQSGSHISGVILGRGVKLADNVQLGEGVQIEEGTQLFSPTTQMLFPTLGAVALNTQGEEIDTAAFFGGGASVNEEAFEPSVIQTVSDRINIYGEIIADPAHVGQKVDIFVFARHQPLNQEPLYLMLNQKAKVLVWDPEDIASLLSFKKGIRIRHQVLQVPIYQGPLKALGELNIAYGYRLSDGTLVHNQQTIDITVEK